MRRSMWFRKLAREFRGGDPSFAAWLSRVRSGERGPGLRWDRRVLFFAFVGLVMGTCFDAFHVLTKTATYVDVWKFPYLEVAWYVPLEFTAAGIVVGMVRPVLDARFHGPNGRLVCLAIALGLGCLCIGWGGSGLLTPACWSDDAPKCWSDPNVPYLGFLLVLGVGGWVAFDRTWEGIVAALITAGIGVSIELALIHLDGSYRYLHADFHGVPIWLPALYIIACGSIGNLGRYLKQRTGPPACGRVRGA